MRENMRKCNENCFHNEWFRDTLFMESHRYTILYRKLLWLNRLALTRFSIFFLKINFCTCMFYIIFFFPATPGEKMGGGGEGWRRRGDACKQCERCFFLTFFTDLRTSTLSLPFLSPIFPPLQ